MEINLENLEKNVAFDVKVQISLIFNAQRVMDLYPDKKDKFQEYINERKEKIRKMLNIQNGKIFENGKLLIEI